MNVIFSDAGDNFFILFVANSKLHISVTWQDRRLGAHSRNFLGRS